MVRVKAGLVTITAKTMVLTCPRFYPSPVALIYTWSCMQRKVPQARDDLGVTKILSDDSKRLIHSNTLRSLTRFLGLAQGWRRRTLVQYSLPV